MKMIMWDKPLHIVSCQHRINNRFGYPQVDIPGYDFQILFNDFIGNAQRIVTAQESPPNFVVMASR